MSECERVAGALLALRGEPKVSGKAAVLDEYAGDGAVRRVLRFLADENKVTGLSTKKLARTVPPVPHNMGLADLAEYLCEHNNGGDREVGMVLFFLSLIGDERGRDVAAQVLAKKWPLTVGASLLNRVYGPGFVPEFNAQLAFTWEKKISAYGDDAVFIHGANTERHALNSGDYTYYGAYDATVERVTLTDYTVRTDYGAVLTVPYSMGWVDGHVDKGDRVALDVSRMSTNENQSIIVRGGDDMDVMFLMDEACVSRFDSRGARVPRGVECHRAFGDTEYKGSALLGGGGTYYVLTGVSRL